MANTPHLALTLVEQSQAQKEVTVNEAFLRIDAVLNVGAIDRDLTSPPLSPTEGDVYIVASGASDDWAGHDNELAYFNQIWRFITPNAGLFVWVGDESAFYVFDGTSWQLYSPNVQSVQNASLVGVNTTADTTNRLAVSSDAVLITHAGSNARVNLNKNAVGDTASFIFQNNFSARAEFGLTGNDDFSFRVTPDNFTTAFDAFTIESATGLTRIREDAVLEKNLQVDGFFKIPAASIITLITYLFFALYATTKMAQYHLLTTPALPLIQPLSHHEAIVALWTENDMAVFTAIIAFWFGSRLFKKPRSV